jgi:hypothetical protein
VTKQPARRLAKESKRSTATSKVPFAWRTSMSKEGKKQKKHFLKKNFDDENFFFSFFFSSPLFRSFVALGLSLLRRNTLCGVYARPLGLAFNSTTSTKSGFAQQVYERQSRRRHLGSVRATKSPAALSPKFSTFEVDFLWALSAKSPPMDLYRVKTIQE